MTISIIVAADEQNGIGRDNNLLCYLPNDLRHFKSITIGQTIIMGRKTYESLPNGALPNRRNIVITRNSGLSYPGCEMCFSIEDSLALCKEESNVFFIGGGTVYNEVFDLADVIFLTRIHHCFDNVDTFFPTIDETMWKEVSRADCFGDEKNMYGHSFLKYEKIIG